MTGTSEDGGRPVRGSGRTATDRSAPAASGREPAGSGETAPWPEDGAVGALFAADPPPSPLDPLWSAPPLRHRAALAVLGHGLDVASNAPGLVELARAAFGRFAPAGAARPRLALDLVAGDMSDIAGGIASATAPIHRERGDLFVAADGDGGLVAVDLDRGRGTAFVSSAARPEAVRAVILEASAYRFLTRHGLCALHAGTVVVGGRALVLRGAGGAGKSTLCYAAARAGHAVLADEVTWWDAADGLLRGTPWSLRLEPEAAAIFPELGALAPAPRAQGAPKLDVDVAALGLVAVERAPAGPLVLLEASARRPAASRWRRIDPAEACRWFDRTAIPGEHAQPPERLAAVVGALQAHGAYALEAGDPGGAVEALEAIARDAGRGATLGRGA